MVRLAGLGGVLVVATLGCQAGPPTVAQLQEKARELAEVELAKFNAIERTYQDVVDHHENTFMPEIGGSVYLKMYRVFESYEVRDIRKTDSVIQPYFYDILYKYRLLSTRPREASDPASPEKAKGDREFIVAGEYYALRSYPCDDKGNYRGTLPDLPTRDTHYNRAVDSPKELR
ncbi:MAG: hypothetical protein HY706_20245 [Candidatus Hydrogenedentes bacterium]|nr:hypothetical protein [Candidatus Hydrogenedentota bacterium]